MPYESKFKFIHITYRYINLKWRVTVLPIRRVVKYICYVSNVYPTLNPCYCCHWKSSVSLYRYLPPLSLHTPWWTPRSTRHTQWWMGQTLGEVWSPPTERRQTAGGRENTSGRCPKMRWPVQTKIGAIVTRWKVALVVGVYEECLCTVNIRRRISSWPSDNTACLKSLLWVIV